MENLAPTGIQSPDRPAHSESYVCVCVCKSVINTRQTTLKISGFLFKILHSTLISQMLAILRTFLVALNFISLMMLGEGNELTKLVKLLN